MASAVPVPEQPGRLYIPSTGSVVQQDQQYEGDFYDTVEFTSFAVGQAKLPFKDQNNKDLQFTNLTQTKRIPSYAKLKLQRLGVHVRQWDITARPDEDDVLALYEMASLRFTLGTWVTPKSRAASARPSSSPSRMTSTSGNRVHERIALR